MTTHFIRSFWKDEEGQATTEYILLLSMIVTFLLLLMKKVIGPAFQKVSGYISKAIQSRIINADLHTFRITK